jgi:hypothetical protein
LILPLLRAEAESQADRLRDTGIRIAFVNGHEHAHLFPGLWPIVAGVARRLGARAVRAALGQPIGLSPAGALAAASRFVWALSPIPDVVVLSPLGVGLARGLTVDAAGVLLARPFAADERRMRELCVHPGLDEPGGRAEYDLLASGAIDGLLERRALRRATGLPH